MMKGSQGPTKWLIGVHEIAYLHKALKCACVVGIECGVMLSVLHVCYK